MRIPTFVILLASGTLSACAHEPLQFHSATLGRALSAGIHEVEPCSPGSAIGAIQFASAKQRISTESYCLSVNRRDEAWAYIWINAEGEQRVCFAMVGYAETLPNGITESGRRVDDCHIIEGDAGNEPVN
jgi:hypothetical protein